MAKKIKALIKLNLKAGQATAAPPVGTALGQQGVAIMDFVKQYNAATAGQKGKIIPVVITVYEDRTFTFITKLPPAAEFIKEQIKIKKGSSKPGKDTISQITREELRQIAQKKLKDLNARSIDAAVKIIEGSAKSMGIQIKG